MKSLAVLESHVAAGYFSVPDGLFRTEEEKTKVAALEQMRQRLKEVMHLSASEIREERAAELVALVESGELQHHLDADELPEEVHQIFEMTALRARPELNHARRVQLEIVEDAITRILHSRRLARAGLGTTLITEHLRPALRETMEQAEKHAVELESTDPESLLESGAAAVEHFEKMKPIAARYEAIRQSYVGVIDEENREVLRNRERRLWSEVKNLDEIWPEYLELSSVQITPGLRKDPAPLPTPWPSSTRAKLVWFVQNWAEVWLPTTEEIFAVSTAEERETAARSTAGESELERKHRRSVEANKRMSDSRQRA